MTDREKLIELIGQVVVPYFAVIVADHLISHGVRLETKQATSEKTSEKTSDKTSDSKWISVEDRLPELNTCVFAYLEKPIDRMNSPHHEQILVLWLRNYKLADGKEKLRWERPFSAETIEYFPTHWMPQPQPTREE